MVDSSSTPFKNTGFSPSRHTKTPTRSSSSGSLPRQIGQQLINGFFRAALISGSFGFISHILKNHLVEVFVLPYMRIIKDQSIIPFVMMGVLFLFGYVINDIYVGIAKAFACDNANGSEDYIVKQMKRLKQEFISNLPGFVMAYVAAKVGKVFAQTINSLCIVYTISLVGWMLTSIMGISALSQFLLCMAQVSCLKMFLYACIPNYSAYSSMALRFVQKYLQSVIPMRH